MIFAESASAHALLDGHTGIEIGGAAHNPFNIPGCRNVDFSDSMTTGFKTYEIEQCGRALPVDVVAPGDCLPFADASLDYVLSSHVFEHFWDPIAAVGEWLRVLRPGGIVFMIVPHKERTFDAATPRTLLFELIDRHAGRRCMAPDADPTGHHNIWITADVVELVTYLGLEILRVDDIDDKVGNGFTVVFKKPGTLAARRPTLDVGGGSAKRPGSIGIRRQPGPDVDMVLDLERSPLPFADDSIPHVHSDGLFHLLDDPATVLRELVRVAQNGATIDICTPHASNDGAAEFGARRRFAEVTWVNIVNADLFAACRGSVSLKEIVLYVPPPTVEDLKARNVPLDFAIRHHRNVISRMRAVLTVHKPAAPATGSYPQRVMLDPG